MRCTFCATGKGGFARNLKPHEIVDQVLTVQQQFGARVNNVGALRCMPPCFVPMHSRTLVPAESLRNTSHDCIRMWRAPAGCRQLAVCNLMHAATPSPVRPHCNATLRRAVFMGMGEPLLNVRAIVEAVRILNLHLGIGGRSITISTVGVPNAIAMLAEHKLQATLAVSVHAPNQALRERLVPSAKVYPLQALMLDCQAYFKATSRRVTFEYTLMHGVNNGVEHVRYC